MEYLKPQHYFSGDSLALVKAIDSENQDEIETIAGGVDLDTGGRGGFTPLIFATLNGRRRSIETLIRLGADPTLPHERFGPPVGLAVDSPDSDALAGYLNAGVDPDLKLGQQPLIVRAAHPETTATIELLIERGADINQTLDPIGKTAIFEALLFDRYDTVMLLIKRGADVHRELSDGRTLGFMVDWELDRRIVGAPDHKDLEQIRSMLIEGGLEFPADPPGVVLGRRAGLC